MVGPNKPVVRCFELVHVHVYTYFENCAYIHVHMYIHVPFPCRGLRLSVAVDL